MSTNFSPGDQVVTPDGREATVHWMDVADRDFYRVPEGSVVVRPDGEPDDVHYPASDLHRSDKGRVVDVTAAERLAYDERIDRAGAARGLVLADIAWVIDQADEDADSTTVARAIIADILGSDQ